MYGITYGIFYILNQGFFLKKMLFSDVISFYPCYISQISNHFCWYQQKLKSGKVTSFFLSQLTCERRSLSKDMTWSFLSINPGLWLTDPFRTLKRGDSFDFKRMLTIFSLQEKVFNKYIVDLKKKWNLQLFFADKSVLLSQLTLITVNALANCHF